MIFMDTISIGMRKDFNKSGIMRTNITRFYLFCIWVIENREYKIRTCVLIKFSVVII